MTRGTITVAVTAYKRAAVTAAGLLVTGAIAGASRPHPAIIPVAAITLAVLLVTVGERVIPSSRERVFWAAVTVTAGGWLTACASTGLDEIKAALLTWGLIGFPIWWTVLRRIRRISRDVLTLQAQWAEAATAEQLEGAALFPVIDRDSGNWRARVQLPAGRHVEDVTRVARRLESRLRLAPQAITVTADRDDASVVEVSVMGRRPVTTAVTWPGPPRDASITRPAVIGSFLDHEGGPIEVPLRGACVLVGGRRGSGKSGVVNALVGYLTACPDAVLWGIDLKGGVELDPWAPVFQRIAVTGGQVRDLLRDAVTVMEDRLAVMASRGERDWPVSPSRPALVIVIDEQSEIAPDAESVTMLERLGRLCRAASITIVMATQYPTKDTVGSKALLEQVTVSIGLRVRSAVASRALFGEHAGREGWNAHAITGGPGTLFIDTTDTPRLGRAWQVTDAKRDEIVTAYQEYRPALEGLGAARPAGPMDGDHPGGTAPTNDSNSDIRGEGGGEDPVDLLRELLHDAPAGGMHRQDLVDRTGMSLAWVKKWLASLGASSPARGYWRLP